MRWYKVDQNQFLLFTSPVLFAFPEGVFWGHQPIRVETYLLLEEPTSSTSAWRNCDVCWRLALNIIEIVSYSNRHGGIIMYQYVSYLYNVGCWWVVGFSTELTSHLGRWQWNIKGLAFSKGGRSSAGCWVVMRRCSYNMRFEDIRGPW
jgi:hypothetical protein